MYIHSFMLLFQIYDLFLKIHVVAVYWLLPNLRQTAAQVQRHLLLRLNYLAYYLLGDCEVLGISVDSHFTHRAWCTTRKADGGLEGAINHPLVSDLKKDISRQYGVLLEDAGVATISGTSFGELGEGYLRLSYANSVENIQTGIDRVAKFLS